MCGGLEYDVTDAATGEHVARKAYFPIPHCQLPVVTEDGIRFMQWGRRKGEDNNFDVPQTGWARLQSLVEGKWNRYEPKKVKIPAKCWMEKDSNRESHWFDMADGEYLLGVHIQKPDKDFVYIVTKPADDIFKDVHNRMPMTTK